MKSVGINALGVKAFLSLVCLLVVCTSLIAQDVISKNRYGIQDGLEDRIVLKTIRDAEGKFWVFTKYGVQLFNGSRFQALIKLPIELQADRINTLSIIDNKSLLIVTDNPPYLYRLNTDNGSVAEIKEVVGASHFSVKENRLSFINADGHPSWLFLNNFSEVFSSSIKVVTQDVKSIHQETESIWFILYKDRRLSRCEKGNCSVMSYAIDQIIGNIQDSLWVRNDTFEILKIDASGKVSSSVPSLYNRIVVQQDEQGNKLMGLSTDYRRTEKLLFFPAGGGPSIDYSSAINSSLNTIVDFFSDDYTRHILCNTYNGLTHFTLNPSVDQDYYIENIPLGNFGYLIARVFYRPHDKKVYFCREHTGLMAIDSNGKIDSLDNPEYWNAIVEEKYLYYDEKEDVIYSVNGIDSFGFQRYSFQENDFIDATLDYRPKCIRPYGENLVFFGGGKENLELKRMVGNGKVGVYDRTTGNFTPVIADIDADVYDIYAQPPFLYLATNKGVKKYTYQNNTLAYNSDITSTDIWAKYFYPTEEGFMVGTYGRGIYIVEDDKVVNHIDGDQGLSNNSIGSIHYDSEEELYWIGTFNGITVINRNYEVVNTFDVGDGLSENETNSFAFCEDDSGKYYYGTINGLSSFYPEDLMDLKRSEKMVLDKLEYYQGEGSFSRPINNGDKIDLPYGIDSFAIYYSYYDYSFYNNSSDWKYAVRARSTINQDVMSYEKNIIYIEPGSTGNRVIKIADRVHGEKEALQVSVDIQSWLEKFWWLLMFILAIVVLSFLVASLLRKRKGQKKDLIESQLQSKINELKLQSLRSQMNPHFIFNALGSIQYYIETQEINKANDYLSDFASLMRLILESAKNEFIPIQQEIKLLNLYLTLEHMRFDEKYEYNLIVDSDIDSEFSIPPMIIQPFIENAINHGLYHLTDRKGSLTVSIKPVDEDSVEVIIEDNGIGRKAAAELRRSEHISRGIQIVKDRIETLHQNNKIDVNIKIIDLETNDTSTGTKAIINFRYKS